jgi:hypothetical protein
MRGDPLPVRFLTDRRRRFIGPARLLNLGQGLGEPDAQRAHRFNRAVQGFQPLLSDL